ncbi:MAG: carboxy-S-adenosyl-L-methionine synthase CmoA [Fibrobacterota bacterium]
MARDKIFRTHRDEINEFTFDEEVAAVFDDMLKRSVPGYGTILSLIALCAQKYVTPGSAVYDLGASRGASTMAMAHNIRSKGCSLYAVDNSRAMYEKLLQAARSFTGYTKIIPLYEDILTTPVQNASLTVLNLTLQFVPLKQRDTLMEKIHAGTLPGGCLFLAEKVKDSSCMTGLYYDFKRANGYNDLEISQKRSALEEVLIPDTESEHMARLQKAGFCRVERLFQTLNFRAYAAWK